MMRRHHPFSRALSFVAAFAAAGALTADTLAMSSKPLRTSKQVEHRLDGAEAAVVASPVMWLRSPICKLDIPQSRLQRPRQPVGILILMALLRRLHPRLLQTRD